MGSLGGGGFQQHGVGEGGWLFRHQGGFRRANLPSRLSEMSSYLPESLVEPQLLRILPRDCELHGFRGRDALQLSWVRLVGVFGGYGARNGFWWAKREGFPARGLQQEEESAGAGGFQQGHEVLPARTMIVGGKKIKEVEPDDLEKTIWFIRFSRSNSGLTTFRSNWSDRTGIVVGWQLDQQDRLVRSSF